MQKYNRIIPALAFCWFLTCCGCDIHIGDWPQAKYDRTMQRQEPLATGSTVIVGTKLGSVTITGAELADCSVIAEITGRAPTEEEAQELAEKVDIELEKNGNILTVKAHKPSTKHNRSVSISYTITVPKQTHVECSSSYGAIQLSDIGGNVSAKTSNGSISAENVEGAADLDTSYGSVTCRNISGDHIDVKTSSGAITTEHIKGSTQLDTSYGSISCTDFSAGDIKLKSSSGKIRLTNASFGDCDVHTSYGSIDAEQLEGDSIKLHSDSGSIHVTNASAATADFSTSYGRVTGRQITANELIARSGSGNLDITCSGAAPADIAATLVTSYGSIDFTAPLDFAGQADLSTSYGSVTTDKPITVSGEISRKKLKGTIGEGNGKLHLQTSSGSISLKQQTR